MNMILNVYSKPFCKCGKYVAIYILLYLSSHALGGLALMSDSALRAGRTYSASLHISESLGLSVYEQIHYEGIMVNQVP